MWDFYMFCFSFDVFKMLIDKVKNASKQNNKKKQFKMALLRNVKIAWHLMKQCGGEANKSQRDAFCAFHDNIMLVGALSSVILCNSCYSWKFAANFICFITAGAFCKLTLDEFTRSGIIHILHTFNSETHASGRNIKQTFEIFENTELN